MSRFRIALLPLVFLLLSVPAAATVNVYWNGALVARNSILNVNQGIPVGVSAEDTSCTPGLFCYIGLGFGGAGGWVAVGGGNSNTVAGTFYAGYTAGDFNLTLNGGTYATIRVAQLHVTVDPVGNVAQSSIVPIHASTDAYDQSVNWFISSAAGYVTTDWDGPHLHVGTIAGTYTLTASSVHDSSRTGSVSVKVLPPIEMFISPTSVTVAGGQQQRFTAAVVYGGSSGVSWWSDAGNLGDLGGSNGSFQANLVTDVGWGGSFHVTATSLLDPTKSATANVTVVGVRVSPYDAVVEQGGALQMRATVTGSSQPVTWSTTAPGVSIDSTGYLVASRTTAVGTYSVTATTVVRNPGELAVSGTTPNFRVQTPQPPASVAIDPPEASVIPGHSAAFLARVYTAAGALCQNQSVTWAAAAPATVSAAGRFSAPALAGRYTVTASSAADPTKKGTVTVTVPASLVVAPAFTSLAPGAAQRLAATVLGLANTSVTWSVQESGGGVVDATGLYTAPATTGAYHVIARSAVSSQVDAVATFSVSASPTVVVDVVPDGIEMSRRGATSFSAVVEGSTNQAVTWSASGGSVDASGRYTAPSAFGSFIVTARSVADGRAVGTAVVVVSDGEAGQSFKYDNNGNVAYDGVRTFEWDAENRLAAVVSGSHRSEFGYDGNGRRVLVVEKDSDVVTSRKRYLWLGDDIVAEVNSPASAGFGAALSNPATAPTGGKLAATESVLAEFYPGGMRSGGALFYFEADNLGSIHRVYDASGNEVSRFEYDPFGRLTIARGTTSPKFGFAGYFHHAPSGLWLTKFRAYDPDLGRWVSPDPIGEAGGVNLYAYVENDPVNDIDPLGLQGHAPDDDDRHPGPRDYCGGGPTTPQAPTPHHPHPRHHPKKPKPARPHTPKETPKPALPPSPAPGPAPRPSSPDAPPLWCPTCHINVCTSDRPCMHAPDPPFNPCLGQDPCNTNNPRCLNCIRPHEIHNPDVHPDHENPGDEIEPPTGIPPH